MSTISLIALIGLLAVNRLVLALTGYRGVRPLFWGIQLLNLTAVILLVQFGLPSLPPGLRVINYFIALVFMLHIVENNSRRVKVIKASIREPQEDPHHDKRALIRERIKRAEAHAATNKDEGVDR